MANANSTASIKSIESFKVDIGPWSTVYEGTKDELSGGLLKPEWFPGMPGIPKCGARIGMIDGEMRPLPFRRAREQDEKGLIIIRQKNKSIFRVYVRFSSEEVERRKLKEDIEKSHIERNRKLELAPKTPAAFAQSRKDFIRPVLEHILNMFRRSENGFHYSRDAALEARDLVMDLIALAEDGKVYFDQQRQDYFIDDAKQKADAYAANEHPEFSAFMAATLAIGKAALEGGHHD